MKRSLPPPVAAAVINPEPGSLHYATGRKQQVILRATALAAMRRHRQLRNGDPEAGGMLFARISARAISIEEATEPQHADRRWRFGFWPCSQTQQRIINARFKAGLHFVGEWHTHPEPIPHPSGLDFASMERCFLTSRHELKALVMIILGTAHGVDALWVSLHHQRDRRQLKPIADSIGTKEERGVAQRKSVNTKRQ